MRSHDGRTLYGCLERFPIQMRKQPWLYESREFEMRIVVDSVKCALPKRGWYGSCWIFKETWLCLRGRSGPRWMFGCRVILVAVTMWIHRESSVRKTGPWKYSAAGMSADEWGARTSWVSSYRH